MTHDEILDIVRSKKYNPISINETDGQIRVFVDSRRGITDTTLFKRFSDTRLRVVGFGRENGRHYILFRDVGVSDG
ncbi:hypothetical protein KAR91_71030 [Candidatus Pacearchaeota archaeon]|nr:hypothetical protein [Candidatus Pacearchaeota archaeon]